MHAIVCRCSKGKQAWRAESQPQAADCILSTFTQDSCSAGGEMQEVQKVQERGQVQCRGKHTCRAA